MKILQITMFFFPSPYGTEQTVANLSLALSRRGHQVDILTTNTEHAPEKDILEGRVGIIRTPLTIKYRNGGFSAGLFKVLMKAKDYDVYHIHLPFPLGLEAAIVASKLNHIPLVANHHGEPIPVFGLYSLANRAYGKFYKNLCLRYISWVIFHMKSYAESLRLSKSIRERCRYIRPAVDTGLFSPRKNGARLRKEYGLKSENRVVLFVAKLRRWEHRKGGHCLVQAMAEVNKALPDARLIMVGGGDLVPELEELAESLGLKDVVRFVGPVFGERLARHYALCDLFVLASYSEPFGYVVQESMASGKATIVTDVPGAGEIVEHGETGWKVPPNRPDVLAGAIIHLLVRDELRKEMGAKARRRMESYTWDDAAEATLQVYREAIG